MAIYGKEIIAPRFCAFNTIIYNKKLHKVRFSLSSCSVCSFTKLNCLQKKFSHNQLDQFDPPINMIHNKNISDQLLLLLNS